MRIEFDADCPTAVANDVANPAIEDHDVRAAEALREGVRAAQAGNRSQARAALLRATELDPSSESAWLWLASLSEYPEELLIFLNNVLDINPHNARALEWMTATKSLLAKTFVQRGVDGAKGGQADLAAQCFNQALENDQSNVEAWLWLAKLTDSKEGKLSYLEKVLELDPSNEEARSEYQASKNSINQALLAEARAAAVAGRKSDANELLDAFIAENPNSEDGWILRSHLADAFAEKITAFERVLEINPANLTARSGIDSLKAIMAIVSDDVTTESNKAANDTENTAFAIDSERRIESEVVHDKSPTQDLVFPEGACELQERMTTGPSNWSFQVPESAAHNGSNGNHEPTPPNDGCNMNTDALSFAFPSGEMGVPASAEEVDRSFGSEMGADDSLYESSSFEAVETAPEPLEEVEPAYTPRIYDADSDLDDPIPAPLDFTVPAALTQSGFETTPVSEKVSVTPTALAPCPFCDAENPANSFTCADCLATLTLSELDMLFANSHADKEVLLKAIEKFEGVFKTRPLTEEELTNLGIAHLNLRDLQNGYQYLQAASQLNPNNFVLASQVNSLLIRLDDIRRQEEAMEAMPKEKKILVVDDSATVRKLIAGKLEKCGHEVFCAADGVEALEQIEAILPDLILLDINMPRMDGYQVCKVIRGKESTKDVPVVMISGKDGFFDKVRGRMAGTSGYITKPFGPETLMKAVEAYLSGEAL